MSTKKGQWKRLIFSGGSDAAVNASGICFVGTQDVGAQGLSRTTQFMEVVLQEVTGS